MIVKPRTRGFICTTAHPTGCEENVRHMADYAREHAGAKGPGRVLVVGSSTGYGLAARISAAMGRGADTVGVCLERAGLANRTGTAGYYNDRAFVRLAREAGREAVTVIGDAFSREVKQETIGRIRECLPGGQVDLIIYSLAAPKRVHPDSGEILASVIKPIGAAYRQKTVDFHTGCVSEVTVEPATREEIAGTVGVMGGDDWLRWIAALEEAGALAGGACTVAFSYIGPELTHPVYKDGTIGRAKEDVEDKGRRIDALLRQSGGKAFVCVNKALVTQASSAIPVVPLYISLLYRVMKERGTHEGLIEQMARLMGERLYDQGVQGDWGRVPVDERGRIRLDDREMAKDVQAEVARVWPELTTHNVGELTDLAGYRGEFFGQFGFGVDGVDYEAEVEVE